MNERSLHIIQAYLQREDVQERIRQNIQRGRSEVTVTIGRAAHLFGFTENKLRDWETLGLLTPLKPTGQRQYTPEELDKLAIIKELIDEGGYSPGTIPHDIDRIWASIANERQDRVRKDGEEEIEHLHIDQYTYIAYKDLFWRNYASEALRLSIMLICENLPLVPCGMVLPAKKQSFASITRPEELSAVGDSLVGWLGQTRSFYTLLTDAPTFEYPSDYRVFPLKAKEEDIPKDCTWLIVEREAAKHLILKKEDGEHLNLSATVVETVRRLLAPLYEDVLYWQRYFGHGMRDLVSPASDFESNLILSDIILNGITNMVVRLGGQTSDGQKRWRFCCILLPKDSMLPLQQRSLVVRAQSKNAPHKIGVTTISPQMDKPLIGLSLRAFQSAHVAVRSNISAEDTTIAYSELEGPIRSAIAVPVGGENGLPIAALYVVSDESSAFSKGDQCVLRMIGRMIEELLSTYHTRLQVTEELAEIIRNPDVVDPSFEDFVSENEFRRDVELLLANIQTRMKQKEKRTQSGSELNPDPDTNFTSEQLGDEVVSFIGVDIDNQSRLANRYGDQMMRKLSNAIGLRIQRELGRLFTEHTDCRLYHIYADRFYLLLKDISLQQARDKAIRLKQILNGSYQINALRSSTEESLLPDSMQVLSISVRLGVTSYSYTKLEDLLQRFTDATAVGKVEGSITRALDETLEKGRIEGGDVVITWDPNPDNPGFMRWLPSKAQ